MRGRFGQRGSALSAGRPSTSCPICRWRSRCSGRSKQIEARPGAFTIGVHGLVVEQGSHRGLLLPQVATEWGWDAEQFLRQTCVKAGLPPDAWRNGARVFRFAAEVFGD